MSTGHLAAVIPQLGRPVATWCSTDATKPPFCDNLSAKLQLALRIPNQQVRLSTAVKAANTTFQKWRPSVVSYTVCQRRLLESPRVSVSECSSRLTTKCHIAVIILFINALAVLSEDRFLARSMPTPTSICFDPRRVAQVSMPENSRQRMRKENDDNKRDVDLGLTSLDSQLVDEILRPSLRTVRA